MFEIQYLFSIELPYISNGWDAFINFAPLKINEITIWMMNFSEYVAHNSLKCFFVFLFVFQCYSISSQNTLSAEFKKNKNQHFDIYRLKGEKRYLIDSVRTDNIGKIVFELPANLPTGILMITDEQGKSLKLIYNQQTVNLKMEDFKLTETLEFIASTENTIWFEYLKLSNETQLKERLIRPVLDQYPKNSRYYKMSLKEYNKLNVIYLNYLQSIGKKHKETYAYLLMRTDMVPVIPLNLNLIEKKEFLMQHFLDSINFNDTLLLNSDILTKKMIDFVALHQPEESDVNKIQTAFIKGLDQILLRASKEEKMYFFVLEFFLEGFTEMGLSTVTDYLSDLPYFKSSCMDVESMMKIEQLVEPYRKLKVGAIAPPIKGNRLNGTYFSLDQLQSANTIILFWSVYCPFCIELLPKLKSLKLQHPGIEIVSIIIGEQADEVKEFIEQEKLDWIHLYNGLKWESPNAVNYKVYGTPTIFLLNKNHQIIAKPITFQELENMLNN